MLLQSKAPQDKAKNWRVRRIEGGNPLARGLGFMFPCTQSKAFSSLQCRDGTQGPNLHFYQSVLSPSVDVHSLSVTLNTTPSFIAMRERAHPQASSSKRCALEQATLSPAQYKTIHQVFPSFPER